MRTTITTVLLALVSAGCTSLTPQGAAVRVYEAEIAADGAPIPAMPSGCRRVGSGTTIQEQEQARHVADPYRAERNAVASSGGNILLVTFRRVMTLKRT